MPDRSYPLARVLTPSGPEDAAVTIGEVRPQAILAVSAWPDTAVRVADALTGALGVAVLKPNRVAVGAGLLAVGLAPGRVIVFADDPASPGRIAERLSPEVAAVVDLSHARVGFRLTGAAAPAVLNKGLAIDLGETAFPVGAAAQSTIAYIGTLLVHRDIHAYDLFVYTSFAVAFAEWLQASSEEFGVRIVAPVGIADPTI